MNNPPKNDTPDKALVLAREVVARMKEVDDAHHTAKLLRAGEYDEITEVRLVRAGIEAALSQPQHGGLVEACRKAHDTLIELNPNNYTHDDVCEASDATVEAILILADALGERHGKTAEWWAERRAALASNSHVVGENKRVIPAGMKPWHGGDRAPNDWDGGPILCRDADGPSDPSDKGPWYWKHDNSGSDIIAYTPKPTPTDTADRREAVARIIEGCGVDAAHECDDPKAAKRRFALEGADAIASLIAGPPEGFVMVPVEPTDAMAEAGCVFIPGRRSTAKAARVWSAMIAARPGVDA